MSARDLKDAARQRAQGMRAPADRPQKRRCAPDENAPARVSAPLRNLSVRANTDGTQEFYGMATVYERGYEMYDFWGPYTEIVSAGAGAESLKRDDLDVPLVLQHHDLRRIARTTNGSLELTETDEGLQVLAPNLDPNDSDVRYIVPKLESGLIDEMSFRFRITSGQWSPDYEEYRINAYDIHRGDVSIVGYGANPFTSGGIRSADLAKLVADMSADDARRTYDILAARFTPTSRVLITDEDTRIRTTP